MAKKVAYPVILKPDQEGYYVEIPDFDIATEGDTIAEAMEMARDAIGLMGIDMEDEKKKSSRTKFKSSKCRSRRHSNTCRCRLYRVQKESG